MTGFSNSNIENSFVFNEYFQPGLYMIVNTQKKKYYIGETENIADRLSGHFKSLNSNKRHDCIQLQTDWDAQNGNDFSFRILFIGPEWSERTIRLQKERELILFIGQENVYNYTNYIDYRARREAISRTYRRNSIAVVVDGISYPSIREAAHMKNISTSTALRCLNDPNNRNWIYATPTVRQHSSLSKKIVIEGNLYMSLSLACSVLNISAKTLRKYIRERSDWNYFSDLSQDEQTRILDAHPEIQQISQYSSGRPVQVGQTVYPTIVSCAQAYNIHPSSVRKRIRSKNALYQDWSWAEDTD